MMAKKKNMWLLRRIGLIVVLMALVPAMALAKTIYVKPNANGNGTSWTNAYGDLQDALDAAVSGDEIWVAAGIYKPTYDYGLGLGSRGKHFRMKNGVAIYGGFAGNESVLGQRNIDANETILSGDLNGNDGAGFTNNTENCYHVFYHPQGLNLDASAVLDGVTIKAGNAQDRGAGMYNYRCSPTLTNCTFSGNMAALNAGGMYNYFLSDSTLTNCAFIGNVSGEFGGGMYNKQSNPVLINCSFAGNGAGESGGGMYNYTDSNPTLTDCAFNGNTAQFGGGIFNLNNNPDISNCIFSGNTAGGGGGMYNHKSSPTLSNCTFTGSDVEIRGGAMYNYDNSNPTLTNCILYYNTSPLPEHEIYNYLSTPQISYSDIEGCLGGGSWDASLGSNGGGNIDMDPLFVDADGDDNIYGTEDDDLRLSPGSPCIGAGSNGTDMGAYEFGDTTPTTYMLSVYASGATSVPISSSTGHSGTINYSKTVNDGTTVTLTAPILSGKDFTGWTGSATSGNRTVSFSMNANKTVTANYEASAPTTYSLNVYSDGATGVAISSSTGHAGTTDYIKTINEGTTVTLTAPILSGKDFTDWTGSVSSSSRTISFAMNANKFVTANYEPTTPTLSSISISGSTQVNESSSAQYTATATYSDGSTANVTSSASWTENSSYASISSSGYLTTNSVSSDKSCTITASYGGKTDTHAVTIKNVATVPTLSYITISGSTQVDENSGAQYTCRAYYSDGSSTNVTSAAGWSENSSYASISSTGYLTTASVSSDQSCTITATYGGKSDMHAVTIQDAPSTGTNLTVSSSGASNVTITSTTGFGGTTNYSKAVNDGSLVILAAPATWNGATFTGWTGSVTSSSATIWFTMSGTKSLTANYSGGGGTTPTLSSIAISGSIQVDESSGAQYTCTAYYSDGSSTNVTSSASWSENSSYASISSSGYLTTNSVSSDQSCTVTASYGGKSDTHSVTIKNAPTGCVPSTVSVGAIVPGTSRGSRGRAFGSVTVTVSDNCGNAVANAVVYGTFSGDYSDTLAATTNAQGVATFKTTTEAKKPAYTFCVNNIVKAGLTYRSVDNVESCDSY